jgi:hypothetical protein
VGHPVIDRGRRLCPLGRAPTAGGVPTSARWRSRRP